MRAPLTEVEAEVLVHMAECLTLECAIPTSAPDSIERYGHGRRLLMQVLQGRETEVPAEIRDQYEASRKIITTRILWLNSPRKK